MKTIVEFGVRGGRYGSHVCPTVKEGTALANKLAWTYGIVSRLEVSSRKGWPRSSVTNSTHFVSLSLLDGVPRGSDVTSWRTEGGVK